MAATLYTIRDATAARLMTSLQAGKTPRQLGIRVASLNLYMQAHPEYAAVAKPLIAENAKLAMRRKGARLRDKTHCINGHSLADAYISYQLGYIKRTCRTCLQIRNAVGRIATPAQISRAKAALEIGLTINQIIHGRPAGGGAVNRSLVILDSTAFYRRRREDPEFDAFVRDAIGKRMGNPVAAMAPNTYIYNWVPGDERVIEAMVPRWLADKADVVNDIMVALLEGRLDRSQVAAYVGTFARLRCTMFPTKKARFAGGALLSLDGAVSDGENRTYAEVAKDSLWD